MRNNIRKLNILKNLDIVLDIEFRRFFYLFSKHRENNKTYYYV